MLACVCQPADPGLFRRSPIPLGTPPLKITNRAVAPIPGRSVRVSGPILDAPRNKEPASVGQASVKLEEVPQSSESSNESSKITTCGSSKTASESSSKSSSCVSLSAVRKKCAKRCRHSKRGVSVANGNSKSSDKEEISSLTSDSADCDRKLDGKSNVLEKVWNVDVVQYIYSLFLFSFGTFYDLFCIDDRWINCWRMQL